MPFPQVVERWRQAASWEGKDVPIDILLAIIEHESGGIAGIVSRRKRAAGFYPLPLDSGGEKMVENDLGLMQTGPAVVLAFSKATKTPVTYQDMTGKDERAYRLQIRVGAWYLANQIRNLHGYDTKQFPGKTPAQANENQYRLALIAYARGFGDLKKKLDSLREKRAPLTLSVLESSFPDWRQGPQFARDIWRRYQQNKTATVAIEPSEPIGKRIKAIASEWAIPLALLLFAFFWKAKQDD